jgi:hypothetical protein
MDGLLNGVLVLEELLGGWVGRVGGGWLNVRKSGVEGLLGGWVGIVGRVGWDSLKWRVVVFGD